MAWPNPLTGDPVPLRRRPTQLELFAQAVARSVRRIEETCPRALVGMSIGFEDVPQAVAAWEDHVPLATATPARPGEPGRVVLYRRPIEFRAPTPDDLRILVHRTVVEQLSAATGIPTDELDPDLPPDDDDWD